MQYPHCDQNVLHAPGSCRFCDKRAEWQQLRMNWGINFTGETDPAKLPCPSLRLRALDAIERWPDNRPTRPVEPDSLLDEGD